MRGIRRARWVALSLIVAACTFAVGAGEKASVHTARGEVTSVDTDGANFVIQVAAEKTKTLTLHIDEHTKFVKDGEQTKFDNLATGSVVTVNYKEADNGRKIALSVGISS